MRRGEIAADHDRRRVEEVDARSEHLAKLSPGLADGLNRQWLAGAHERDDVACFGRFEAGRGQLLRQRTSACDGLEATRVAAPADDVVISGHPDVTDVAGR